MPVEERSRFIFTSTALDEDTFTVVQFKGTEAISRLYEFEIILDAEDPEINLKEVLKNPVCLKIERNEEVQRTIHGILARFEQLHEYSEHVYYRAVLVPRLWLVDQHHENQLFLDKKVPEIIEDILTQAGLTSNDYELKLTSEYPAWEYVCQYNETDFNFISRWMEREGIYYYFEQGEDAEKLIITDSSTAHQDIAGESVRYSPPDSLIPSVREQVREFTCRQQMPPQKVILKDYNYRKPSLDLKGEAEVDSEGRGNVYIYGEHFKTPEEGNALAAIRAEELLCREAVFHGEGTVPPFLTGYIFEMHDHYRDSYNQRYLITELSHEGVQANYLTGTSSQDVAEEETTPSYFNRFTCIPAEAQFRPERISEKPKFNGTINARVDAAGDDQYAEIDDEGRYKITLPFDQSGNKDGKASRWVRMAQPFAGDGYGMHFPLHKGVEVLLTFIDGDPDRPIIAGSVPNPETASPVTAANHTQHKIQSRYGHNFIMDDANPHWEVNSGGGHQLVADDGGRMTGITMTTSGNHKIDASDSLGGIFIDNNRSTEQIYLSDGQFVFINSGGNTLNIKNSGEVEMKANTHIKLEKGATHVLLDGSEVLIHSNGSTGSFKGNEITLQNGASSIKMEDAKISIESTEVTSKATQENGFNYSNKYDLFYGFKNEMVLGQKSDTFGGIAFDTFIGGKMENFAGIKMTNTAAVVIENGAAPVIRKRSASIDDEGAVKIEKSGMSLKKASAVIRSAAVNVFK